MIRKYRFVEFYFEVTVHLDDEKLTADQAEEIARFWASSNDVIKRCKGGCHYEAVARYAASRAVVYAMEGYDSDEIPAKIQQEEGWYDHDFGLSFTWLDVPELPSADHWRLEEDHD